MLFYRRRKKHAFLSHRKKHAFYLEDVMGVNQCPCGSGLYATPTRDGYGIFLCYTCEACYEKSMLKYRPDIMERYEADEPVDEE